VYFSNEKMVQTKGLDLTYEVSDNGGNKAIDRLYFWKITGVGSKKCSNLRNPPDSDSACGLQVADMP
jgi:hypothetical protein